MYDGFFYVNGDIYIGYLVNKILKDIIICVKRLSGFDVFYVFGWDCYGFFIEYNVEKKIGKVGVKVFYDVFCKKCCEYVIK